MTAEKLNGMGCGVKPPVRLASQFELSVGFIVPLFSAASG
jgi:hypothetical protein